MATNFTYSFPSLIFFDIDGTLCRYKDTVTNRIRLCFSALHERGHRLFICTGRSPADISQDILSLGFDGIISCMGATVSVGSKILRHKCMPEDQLISAVQMLLDMRLPALILGNEAVLRTEQMIPSKLETGVIRSVEDLYRSGVAPDISTFDIEFENVEKIGGFIQLISQHSEFIKYNAHSGQTRLHGVNKASGIDLIRSLPEYAGMKSYAIGDSQNDLEMLESVDVAISMGDAPPEVLLAADWCAPPVEQDGVYYAMKQFLLI